MKRYSLRLLGIAGLALVMASGAVAQDIIPTPYFTSFADTLVASTFNGELLVVGSVIKAYDTSGVYCGTDTVRLDGGSGEAIFGYFAVYGDDPATTGVDEGAEPSEPIRFTINDRTATVTAGDSTWTDKALKSVTLDATATIAVSAVTLPGDTLIMPGSTVTIAVEVRNDGDGLDFYGAKLVMSIAGSASPFDWEALEPDSVVYAAAGQTATVLFSVRAPTFNADTVNTVSYTVFSNLDTTVTVTGSLDVFMSLTDVNEPYVMLPGSFLLEQNYPNPFNPTTTIAWELPQASTVRIDIIDVLGRTVESRELGYQSSGPGWLEYDASGLASGVYFYRLTTETSSQSRKMVLLK